MIVELFAKSDVGRVRRGNEDNFLVLDLSTEQTWTGADGAVPPEKLTRFDLGSKGLVLVVSDGMGGALAGDVASRMAVDSVREMLIGASGEDACDPTIDLVECLKNATVYANLAIHVKSQEDSRCAGMGATFTGAAVRGDTLDLVQVGDSRGYVIRKDQIRLATKDQSLVQQLVDVGQISESEAETHMFRNVILQALGAQSEISPVTGKIRLRQGDVVLLCSDGLSGKLRAEDIQHIVGNSNGDLAKACDALVEEANNRGGEDNITVVMARFLGDDLEAPSTDRITIELPPLEEDKTLDDSYEADTEPQH
ncbi:MAG TPA: PP2C family serine/threonine-protein phosphatase [Pyrinomonadaceae bacterium]|jgi:Serine/threonine protein phosphatase|nr:PP2C family serine/threonine-protein phosphatase [Pyrinomonadaceae bacterium]